MIMLMVTGVLVGAVLGLRFKVLVVVPVICVETAIILVDGIARGNGAWWTALAMIAIVTPTQVGYFTGSIVKPGTTTRIAVDGGVSMPRSAGLPGSV
jgi:hypothetical protein